MTGVSDSPLLSELLKKYPGMQSLGLQLVDSSAAGKDWRGQPTAGRQLEFYPPDELYNPKPGKPTIEVFNPQMKPDDLMGEVFSHYLPKTDPRFGEARQKFIAGIDPKQKDLLYGDYQQQRTSGMFGEKIPTFDEWLQNQGGDAYFRGYVANQYPKDSYRPDQVAMFNQLMSYLSQKPSLDQHIEKTINARYQQIKEARLQHEMP